MKPDPDLAAVDAALAAPPNPHAEDMLLRDYFAGQALTRFHADYCSRAELAYVEVAEKCYELADAMLRERTKGPR